LITARANASSARLFLEWDPDQITLNRIADRISAIGYAIVPIGSAALDTARRDTDRVSLRRLFVAGLSSAQIMMYAYPEYLEGNTLDDDIRALMRTASMLITLPVVLYSARPFFDSAWRLLRHRQLGMDIPVSIGLLIAFGASMGAWWTNSGEVYFDSVSMFVFLLLGTRWVESRIRYRASMQRDRLATLPPTLANRVAPDPGSIPAWTLRPGDRVRVSSGERVPADGILQSPATDIDNAWLTGESLPAPIQAGSRIYEGAINLGPSIEILIDTEVAHSTLAKLSQLAEQAASDRPDWVGWADRIGARFTFAILVLAIGHVSLSIAVGVSSQQWLPSLIAVLVVTCPCALSMAGPAAYAAALARLLESGVALSTSRTIERLTRVTDCVFDKTGTLTNPLNSTVRMDFGSDELWPRVFAIARESQHPLAIAIAAQAQRHMDSTHHAAPSGSIEATQVAGLGISARCNGQTLQLGALRFVDPSGTARQLAHDFPSATVFLAIDGVVTAGFSIDDVPRPHAQQLVGMLHRHCRTVWCVSGDRKERVMALANKVGIPLARSRWEFTPEEKRAEVKQLQSNGCVVLMIGDGLNDAPVLAQADVSIAVQTAAPLARQKADIYLLRPGLQGISVAIEVCQKAKHLLNQNLVWALGYNLVVIPFALAGAISPLTASIGMAASSLAVVLNSARLLR